MGCAYVSIYGAEFLRDLAKQTKLSAIALIADTRDGVTHPAALQLALDAGWSTRVVNRAQGTFHPKVFMGTPDKSAVPPIDVHMLILGSNNLSRGGLERNVEASARFVHDKSISSAAKMAGSMWTLGVDLTPKLLKDYEQFFQTVNRTRSIRDMKALGISDEPDLSARQGVSRTRSKPKPSFSPGAAKAVWVGLETQTGERRFQPEIPKKAAAILRTIVGDPPVTFDALCADGTIRPVLFEYYSSNDMHRLNVPNDVPGVDDARTRLTGIALVERDDAASPPLSIAVIIDAGDVERVEERSVVLGTWDATPTRFYGWY